MFLTVSTIQLPRHFPRVGMKLHAMAFSFTNKSRKKISKPFKSRSVALAGLPPCTWRWCWVFFFLSSSSNLPFSAASHTLPTTPTSLAPPPLYLKTNGGGGVDSHWRLIVVLSVSALFLTLVFLMAFFKFLRSKIRRRSRRVEDVEEPAGLPKTHLPDLPDSNPQSHSGDLLSEKNPFSSVRRFSWEEIEKLTMNFSREIGEGGFSTVYLAYFSDSTLGAVKIHKNSERLRRLFKQELEVLLEVRHDNIVKLLGYCDERAEGVLLFEYVSNGSLHEKLHDQGGNGNGNGSDLVLPWKNRMSIAFQLARAIEYLHDNCTLQIVHSDVKASNVLLDEQLNCKLCDFGFAKMGFSSTVLPSSRSTNQMMGSPGYMDPHYLRTGIASKKNDVYSFGVMVLELITGIEAFCTEKEKLLTSIAGPMLKDPNKVAEMVDSRLAEDFNVEEAITMASISALCLREQPSLRPSMAEILRNMREKISSVSSVTAKTDVKLL